MAYLPHTCLSVSRLLNLHRVTQVRDATGPHPCLISLYLCQRQSVFPVVTTLCICGYGQVVVQSRSINSWEPPRPKYKATWSAKCAAAQIHIKLKIKSYKSLALMLPLLANLHNPQCLWCCCLLDHPSIVSCLFNSGSHGGLEVMSCHGARRTAGQDASLSQG